jgi:hypothetical protein
MMKKRILLLIFSACITILYGQKEALLKNPNITWLGEGYQDIAMEMSMNPYRDCNFGISKLHKYLSETDSPIDNFLLTFIFKAMEGNKKGLYKDDNCKIPFGDSPIYFTDTLAYIDKETSKRMTQEVLNFFDIDWIMRFRVRQLYYYDAVNVKFGVLPLAIAPIMRYELTIQGDTTVVFKPIFWLKVNNLKQQIKLTEPSITWAASIAHSPYNLFANSPDNKLNVLKKLDEKPQDTFIESIKSNTEITIYLNTELTEKISADVLFKPTTGEETSKAMKEGYYLSEDFKRVFQGLGVVQHWYWDNEKNEFDCYLDATGLAYFFEDENGIKDTHSFYSQTLFYRKNDDK